MERAWRWRGVAAGLVAVAVAVDLLRLVAQLGVRVAAEGSFAAAVSQTRPASALLVLVLAVLVVPGRRADPTPSARTLAGAGAVLAFLVLAAQVVLAVALPVPQADEALAALDRVALLVPLVATAVAAVLLASLALEPTGPRPALGPSTPAPEPPLALSSAEPPASAAVAETLEQPGWLPDAATGVAWRRAGDAASGEPGASWAGTEGEARGWAARRDEGSARQAAAPVEASADGAGDGAADGAGEDIAER